MAGGGHGAGHGPVKLDPGVESWNYMRENVYRSFRFTPKTTRTSLVWGAAIPLLAYYALAGQDLKWDWQGKKRADSLQRGAPSAAEDSQ